MIDEPAAREIALTKLSPDEAVLGAARELDQGWFFPCVMKDTSTSSLASSCTKATGTR